MYDFFLKMLPFIVKLCPLFSKCGKTVIIILIAVSFSIIINNKQIIRFKEELSIPSIDQEEASDYVISYIDQVIYRLGSYTFVSWLIVEKTHNGKYVLRFKDVRGIMPNNNDIVSFKFKDLRSVIGYGKEVVSVKNGNKKNIYQKIFILDGNEECLIKYLKEFEVFNCTKKQAIGYSNIYSILDQTNLKLDKIKLVVVKKENDVIWVFTLFSRSNISDEMQDSDLVGIARTAKYKYFKK